jgi:hypothetical protein
VGEGREEAYLFSVQTGLPVRSHRSAVSMKYCLLTETDRKLVEDEN